MMDVFWQELTSGLHDSKQLTRALIRLIAAALLGGIVGIQREHTHKPAGLRTHMLVSLATAAFVVGCSVFGIGLDAISTLGPPHRRQNGHQGLIRFQNGFQS